MNDIIKLKKQVDINTKKIDDHELRITNVETSHKLIMGGIKDLGNKLPKHPNLNILSYIGLGVGIGGLALFIIIITIYG